MDTKKQLHGIAAKVRRDAEQCRERATGLDNAAAHIERVAAKGDEAECQRYWEILKEECPQLIGN